MQKAILQDIFLLVISGFIVFSFFSFTLNNSDSERAKKVLIENNYTNITDLDVGKRSNCLFKWYSKNVIGQTKFTANKDGKTYTGTVCLNTFIEDKIVLDN